MICKYCGGEIARGQSTCPFCGREADPREKVVEYHEIYVNQPAPQTTEEQRIQAELNNLLSREMIFALLALIIVCVRPIFLIIAFISYRNTDKFISEHRLQAPQRHNTAKILMIITLVFLIVEVVLSIIFFIVSIVLGITAKS